MSFETMTGKCQCEHIDHFEGDGDCCHDYGAKIDLKAMTDVHTDYGTFTVCVDCARTHLKDFLP